MKLPSQPTFRIADIQGQTIDERAELACRLAKQREKAGEYESAYEALIDFWPDRTLPPHVSQLHEVGKAEVLLRVGVLAGLLGAADQTQGSQEAAKNLITQSIELFESVGLVRGAAEARGDLALCYWREGSYDEARINLESALIGLADEESDVKADRKSTRLNSSHQLISYAVFC